MTLFRTLPPLPPDGVISYEVAVITPIARTNIVKNPSVETNGAGWGVAGAASSFRETTRSRYGAYGIRVAPTSASGDGVYYDDSTAFVNGTTYAVSIALRGVPGEVYELSVRTTGGTSLVARQFTATGYWDRISLIYTEASGANRRVYITKIGTRTGDFYVDGLQVEAGAFPTTYLDGDQQGLLPNQSPPAYLWTGTPHASTSVRSGQTRAGGQVRLFSEFDFTLSALIGLGLDPPQLDLVSFSVLDGAQYNDTIKPPRPFTVVGRFNAGVLGRLARVRGGLARLLDRDLLATRQPLVLQITPRDDCGRQIGEMGQVTALYTGGLEGNHNNPFVSEAAISFTTVQDSTIRNGEAGAALTLSSQFLIDYVIRHSELGSWGRLGSGANFNGAVRAFARDANGRIYAAGDFTSAPGGVAANRIAYYDPATGVWNAMGTGAGATVRALAVGFDGSIYAAGDFTSMGGVANTSRIARWDGSAWNALSTGAAANEIYALTIGFDGQLYAGGTFTSIGGVGANRIARWNGSGWNAMGTGAGAVVRALATMLDGSIVAGGDFTTIGGVTGGDRIGRWNGSAWVALSTGMGGSVAALAVSQDGTLYAGGAFTTAGGISISRIASWNGAIWSAMGSGAAGGDVAAITIDPLTGVLYLGGAFTSVDGLSYTRALARWNGSVWTTLDIETLTDTVLALFAQIDGSLLAGLNAITSVAWATGFPTTVVNNGTAITYPQLIVIPFDPLAQTILVSFANNTTGKHVYFAPITVSGAERLIIDFTPDALTVVSSTRGIIFGAVLNGSNFADLALQPGSNSVTIFATNGGRGTLIWPERSLTLDNLVPS